MQIVQMVCLRQQHSIIPDKESQLNSCKFYLNVSIYLNEKAKIFVRNDVPTAEMNIHQKHLKKMC